MGKRRVNETAVKSHQNEERALLRPSQTGQTGQVTSGQVTSGKPV